MTKSAMWMSRIAAVLFAVANATAQNNTPTYVAGVECLNAAQDILSKFKANNAKGDADVKVALNDTAAALKVEIAAMKIAEPGTTLSKLSENGAPLRRAHYLLESALAFNGGQENNPKVQVYQKQAEQHIRAAIDKVDEAYKLQEQHSSQGTGGTTVPSGGGGGTYPTNPMNGHKPEHATTPGQP